MCHSKLLVAAEFILKCKKKINKIGRDGILEIQIKTENLKSNK